MARFRLRLAPGKDPRPPHSESSILGSDRDPRISRPSSIHRDVVADSCWCSLGFGSMQIGRDRIRNLWPDWLGIRTRCQQN